MAAPTHRHASRLLTGTVLRAGHIPRCARVIHKHQTWDKYLQKFFPASTTYLVSDPTSALRTGDVISFRSGWRVGKNVRCVVEKILAPFGTPLEERGEDGNGAVIMSREEREAWLANKRIEKRRRKGRFVDGEEGEEDGVRLGKITRTVRRRLRVMAELAEQGKTGGDRSLTEVQDVGERLKNVTL